ncbi:MAG: hypothetical protein LBQ66_00160 [Planctomycetaceae bacterium]|jgi:hypothetical protein|nr:hypothetical protein [Planctomycetaceae bacterium]
MLRKILLPLALFAIATAVGVISGVTYGAFYPCTSCGGERAYCTVGDPCTITGTNQPGTFSDTKSGKYCKALGLGCFDAVRTCWCVSSGGGAGTAYATLKGCGTEAP